MGLGAESAGIPKPTGKITALPDGLNPTANVDDSSLDILSGDHSLSKWKEEAISSLHMFETAKKPSLRNDPIELAFADDIDLPKEETREKDVPKESEKVERLTYAVRQIDHDGKKILVQVNTEGERKTYIVGGRSYQLAGEDGRFCIPVGTKGAPCHGPVKLHVLTESAKDLAVLQSVLIPFLMNKKGIDWKTIDPNYGIGMGDNPEISKDIGIGQNAKAFTIYVTDIASATWLQTELDKILTNNGLALAKKSFETTDEISGKSNRVGLVREKFIPYTSTNKQPGFLLDAVLERLLAKEFRTKFGLSEGKEFTPGQLNQIELATGLREDSLTYGTPSGQRNSRRALMIVASEFSERQPAYTPEGNKEIGDLTNRTALYALAKRYGIDQIDLARSEIQIETSLSPGQDIIIGRKHQTIADDTYFPVDNDYVKVGRSDDGSWYLQDLGSGSRFKTFVNQRGVSETLQSNQKIAITPQTKITFSEGLRLVFVPVVNPNGLHGNNIEGAKDSTKARIALTELDRKIEKLDLSNLSHKEYADLSNQDIRYLVAHFSELKDVDLSGKQIVDDKSLLQVGYIKQLQHLGLNWTGTTDGDLAFLANCVNLQSLGLNGTKITDAGLTHLSQFPNLGVLGLSHTAITDARLKALHALNRLYSLDLSHTPISDAGMKELTNLKALENLDLRGVNLSDQGLKYLQDLHTLRRLSLDGTNISTAALAQLRQALPQCFISLDRLPNSKTDHRLLNDTFFSIQLEGELADSDVTDAGLGFLQGHNLRLLNLSNTNIGDLGLSNLGEQSDLFSLNLTNTNIGNKGLKTVSHFKNLDTLTLANTNITDEAMADICHMKKLIQLDLSDTDIADAGLEHIDRVSNLRVLKINGTNATAETLAKLKSLPNLTRLVIDNSKITREEVEAFEKCIDHPIHIEYIEKTRHERTAGSIEIPHLWDSRLLQNESNDIRNLPDNSSPLSKLTEISAVCDDFHVRWHRESEKLDLRVQAKNIEEVGNALRRSLYKQEQQLESEKLKIKKEQNLTYQEAETIAARQLLDNPEWLRTKEEVNKLKAEYQKLSQPFIRIVNAADNTGKRLGLPSVQYEISNEPLSSKNGGTYKSGTGKISINATELKAEASLAETAYHELVHVEQDVLIIREFADKVLGDHDLSNDVITRQQQIAKIQELYSESLKERSLKLEPEWLLKVLDVRSHDKSRSLSQTKKERAKLMIQAKSEYHTFPGADLLQKQFQYTRKVLEDLQNPRTAMATIEKMSTDLAEANLQKKWICFDLFGEYELSQPVDTALKDLTNYIKEKKNQGTALSDIQWPKDNSHGIIEKALLAWLHDINNKRESASRGYYDNPAEKEAQITGRLVRGFIENTSDTRR